MEPVQKGWIETVFASRSPEGLVSEAKATRGVEMDNGRRLK